LRYQKLNKKNYGTQLLYLYVDLKFKNFKNYSLEMNSNKMRFARGVNT